MTGETLRKSLRTFGIRQVELARAAGVAEATVSRQLRGGLPLSERVTKAAEQLLVQRGADVAARILDWVELRRFANAGSQEAQDNGSA